MLLLLDAKLTMDDTTKKLVSKKPALCAFLEHCCVARHCSFQVKRCGRSTCDICKPVRMNAGVFSTLHYPPDPIPESNEHYKCFPDVYGEKTQKSIGHCFKQLGNFEREPWVYTLPAPCSYVGLLLQCEECNMWRLLFSRHKLHYPEIVELGKILDDISYTCGVSFSDLELPGR